MVGGGVSRLCSLVARAGGGCAVEDLRLVFSFDVQVSGQASLHAAERVIDEDGAARDLDLELDHGRSARRNADGPHIGQRRGIPAPRVGRRAFML